LVDNAALLVILALPPFVDRPIDTIKQTARPVRVCHERNTNVATGSVARPPLQPPSLVPRNAYASRFGQNVVTHGFAIESPSNIRRRFESLYEFGEEIVSQYVVQVVRRTACGTRRLHYDFQ
jgi:hypothetical protein